MVDTVPAWKWWHPVPFLHVFGIGMLCQILGVMPIVALRELTGAPVPTAIGGGIGGVLMWFWIRHLARKRLAAKA